VEDFQWLRREIVDGGGEASVCRSEFIDGPTDAEVERLFHEARSRDFEGIAADARATLDALPSVAGLTAGGLAAEQRAAAEDAASRLRRRFAAAARIDFFHAPSRAGAAEALEALEARLRPPAPATNAGAPGRDRLRGRTWVTRGGVFVDRIASAWLIRRFIDPEARFRFVAPEGYAPAPGELRFDMFDAEYTHEGDRCTFETLLARFDLADPALAEIAEVVHDIDLKDAKFDRDDAAGIERVLAGIAATTDDDATRLERGAALFDDLYALAVAELGRAPAPTAADASASSREPR